jgi:hypothetical protein
MRDQDGTWPESRANSEGCTSRGESFVLRNGDVSSAGQKSRREEYDRVGGGRELSCRAAVAGTERRAAKNRRRPPSEATDRDPERLQRAISAVDPLQVARRRASSAIENLNSVLRPFLAVQKHTEQGNR